MCMGTSESMACCMRSSHLLRWVALIPPPLLPQTCVRRGRLFGNELCAFLGDEGALSLPVGRVRLALVRLEPHGAIRVVQVHVPLEIVVERLVQGVCYKRGAHSHVVLEPVGANVTQ